MASIVLRPDGRGLSAQALVVSGRRSQQITRTVHGIPPASGGAIRSGQGWRFTSCVPKASCHRRATRRSEFKHGLNGIGPPVWRSGCVSCCCWMKEYLTARSKKNWERRLRRSPGGSAAIKKRGLLGLATIHPGLQLDVIDHGIFTSVADLKRKILRYISALSENRQALSLEILRSS